MPYADIVVMNPEQFKKYYKKPDYQKILDSFSGLILDESTVVKNRQAQITKDLLDYSSKLEYVYLLSGKPAPNSPMDYYTQIQMINPNIFGKNFARFRDVYFEPIDYMGFQFRMKAGVIDTFTKLLSLVSIFIPKESCLDLPEKTYLLREVTLGNDTMKTYKSMEKEQVAVLEDSEVAADNKLASLMKLRQISSGFILDTLDEGGKATYRLDNSKINELEAVLDELGDKKAIIWINFKEEVYAIEELMKKKGLTYVTAYSGTSDVDKSITAFKDNTAQFIIANPKTLKYGVTFTGTSMKVNCTYAIYYSLSFSYEDYYQSHDRIYRKGQTAPCTFLFLLSKDTVDYLMYQALSNKQENASLIETLARGVSEKYE